MTFRWRARDHRVDGAGPATNSFTDCLEIIMKPFVFVTLGALFAMSTSLAVAQASSAPMSSGMPGKMDCGKASKQPHDHAAESGRGTPRPMATNCPPAPSASGAAAPATKKKAGHDHQSTKN